MISKLIPWLLLAIVFSSPAVAANYIDSEGRKYDSKAVANGMMLESGDLTIVLLKDCEASSTQYGKGSWAWANGGFIIKFTGASLGFPRQEIDLNNDHACRE